MDKTRNTAITVFQNFRIDLGIKFFKLHTFKTKGNHSTYIHTLG